MHNNTIHLLVGCGTAGLVTMAEQIKRRAYSKGGADGGIYCYLAVDSDKGSLCCFAKVFERLAGGRLAGLVRTIHLSCDDYDSFEAFVKHHFAIPFLNGNDADGLKRLQEHWWYDDDGRPYGEKQREPERAVDFYGLTWRKLPEIEEAVDNLVEAALNKSWEDGPPTFDVHVIASLAEETGRGSWSLVEFKVRECLEKRGFPVRPVGILFDASIYRDEFCHPEKYLRLKVNALTGLSELSTWMDNERRKKPISYRLPNLDMPARENCDVLAVGCKEKSPRSAEGPICSPLFKCRNANHPCSPAECFKATGRELFLKMASATVSASRINSFSPSSISTSSSATFDVEVDKIDAFCRNRARAIVLNEMRTSSDDVSSAVSQFFESIPINARVRDFSDIRPDQKGSLWQRVAFELVRRASPVFERILHELPTDPDVIKYDLLRSPTVDYVQEALTAVLSALGFRDGDEHIRETVRAFAMGVFRGSLGQRPSLGRLKAFLRNFIDEMAVAHELPVSIEAPIPADVAVKKFRERTILERLLGKPQFSEEEIFALVHRHEEVFAGILVDQLLVDSYGKMRIVIEKMTACVLKEAQHLIASVDIIEAGCTTVLDKLTEDELRDVGISKGTDPFEQLFVVAPDSDLKAIVENGANRILKPIVESRDSLDRLIGEAVVIGSSFGDSFERMVNRVAEEFDKAHGEESLKDYVSHQLSEIVGSHVFLNEDFIEDNFSFLKVLERNRQYWNEEARRCDGNPEILERKSGFFRRTLGAELVIDDNELRCPILPPVRVLKYSIIDTFAYYARPDVSEPHEETMIVSVPFEKEEDWKTYRDKDAIDIEFGGLKWTMIDITDPATSAYSYSAVVDASIVPSVNRSLSADFPDEIDKGSKPEENIYVRRHPFDSISAFGYYRERVVTEKLIESERKDGKPIFDEDATLGGLGHVSPFYVRNDEVSEARWKPWMTDINEDK